MQMSGSIANLATALAKAQAENDHHAESRLLRQMYPVITKAGAQHSKMPLHVRLIERARFGMTDCWHWCGPRNPQGYGRMTFEGRLQFAHRLSYRAFVGPIADGLSVCHACDNPSCINPEHLWLGTYSDNRRDCQNKGRWSSSPPKGFDSRNTKVTPSLLARIRQLRSDGLSYASIGATVGLSAMTVWHAVNGRFN